MLRVLSVALSAALVAVVLKAQDTPARDKYSKDQQEVLDVHRSIQEATLRSDIAALDRLWSADVMFIGGDGRVWNKTQRLEDFRSRNRVPSSLAQPDDLRVRVYGDTANPDDDPAGSGGSPKSVHLSEPFPNAVPTGES